MVWGCFSKDGTGALEIVEGTMNSEKYINILKKNLLPLMNECHSFGIDIFQQDNAPCHKPKSVTSFLERQNIAVLKWPPYSPDLSLIENLWAFVKEKFSLFI